MPEVFRSEMLVLVPALLVLEPEVLVTQELILGVLALIVSLLLSSLKYTCNPFEI